MTNFLFFSRLLPVLKWGPLFDDRRVGVLLAFDHDDICKTIKPLRPRKSVGLGGILSFDPDGWPGIFIFLLKFILYRSFS
jgi:hypothetical protein